MLIRAFSDYHVHVRQGEILRDVLPYTTKHCGRFMVMPNLNPHIISAPKMVAYRGEIQKRTKHHSEVLMTISLTEESTPEMIKLAAEEGCTAVKLYPLGVTTHGEYGIHVDTLLFLQDSCYTLSRSENREFFDNLKMIEETGMVLCIHGELPGVEVLNREKAMLPLVGALLGKFKKLRVVLEHITTVDSVAIIHELFTHYPGRIAATITPHHLMYTLTDLLGNKLQPHLFCKPVLKNEVDRMALIGAATSSRKCFFMGSDSAPWYREQKECASGCAGVWNAPALVSTMFEIFDKQNSLHLLENFTSTFGDIFYGKESVDRQLTVEKDSWIMSSEIWGIVPFRAGDVMRWRVIEH
jgi:dihydroorotase